MLYTLENGSKIEVGKQDFVTETVPVKIGNETLDCPMFSDKDGDIGFIVGEEEILFHWLQSK